MKKSKWKDTDNRFVAFIDILGFKDLVMRSSHKEIFEKLKNISEIKKGLENFNKNQKKIGDAEIHIVSFSDSIVIFSKSDDFNNLGYFLVATSWLFAKAIEKRVPLKGGIAYGEISLDRKKQIYFGQPIIDAYEMEENVDYMGVVAHNSIDSYISEIKDKQQKQKIDGVMLFEEETPLKKGNKTNHNNLNWFRILEASGKITDIINSFKKNCSGGPRRYIENTLTICKQIKTTSYEQEK